MRVRLSLVALIPILLSAPKVAGAQLPGSADTARAVVLRRAIAANWHLRLTSAQSSVDGRVLAIQHGTVRLVGADFPLSEIQSIQRLRKEGGGMLLGGAVAGLGVGLLGAGLAGLCEVDCDWAWAKGFALGAGFGGVIGALIGGSVSPPRRRWDPIWP